MTQNLTATEVQKRTNDYWTAWAKRKEKRTDPLEPMITKVLELVLQNQKETSKEPKTNGN